MARQRLIRSVVYTIGITCLGITSADAQGPCVKRTDLIAHLAEKYREAKVAEGISVNGRLVEVTSTLDGSGWTLFITTTDGLSCLIASGHGWTNFAHIMPGRPS